MFDPFRMLSECLSHVADRCARTATQQNCTILLCFWDNYEIFQYSLFSLPAEVAPSPPGDSHVFRDGGVVLVTGAAGFIGYHVCAALAKEGGVTVVGVDIFSPYYDVQLKRDRASELVKAGVSLYRGDVCDRTLLQFLFNKYNFSHVVHLAAQAGVRHSMKTPQHYLHNNINCFLSLLETIKSHQVTA